MSFLLRLDARSVSNPVVRPAIALPRSWQSAAVPATWLALLLLGSMSPAAKAQSNEWAWMSGNTTEGSFGVYGALGTPASQNVPGSRTQPVTWTDPKDNLWLFGGQGYDSVGNSGYLNDLWEFSTSTNEWTWMGGSSRVSAQFGGVTGVYGTLGTPAATNEPPGRSGAVSWTDAKGNLWLFGGYSNDSGIVEYLDDVWQFNPSTKEWTWMGGSDTGSQQGEYGTLRVAALGNVPGARYSATGSTDAKGNFWLFGGAGYDSTGVLGDLNDLWMFNPSTNEWTWVSGSETANQFPVPGALRSPAPGNVPGARGNAVSWIDGSGNFWIFGVVVSTASGYPLLRPSTISGCLIPPPTSGLGSAESARPKAM